MAIQTRAPEKSAGAVKQLLGSTNGRKAVMSITGLLMFAFIIGHLLGNLLIFQGPEAINSYAKTLRSQPLLLWLARLALLGALGLHVWAALSLVLRARAARPVGYRRKQALEATIAGRSMIYGGIALLAYVVYHLLHLTWGTVHPSFLELEGGAPDVYHNVITGLSVPAIAAVYAVAAIALGLHLFHGLWSSLQTLGVSRRFTDKKARGLAEVVAVLITLGYLSIPVAIQLGWVTLNP